MKKIYKTISNTDHQTIFLHISMNCTCLQKVILGNMTYSSVSSSVQNSNERIYSWFSTIATKTQPTTMKFQANEKDNPDHEYRKCEPNMLLNDTDIGKGIVRLSKVTAGFNEFFTFFFKNKKGTFLF
ncbi:hypothetical protein RFI_38575 [Reticulomyxa filosa]|uniref:Uncharacterized protein n=1 Tax=Reticulomyxa filosa TaxID=46433 RepID=X6LBM1_RETFI|nr:hypothetical protein RFI_38575 [Reticulomyxa filosa]|eukprot:ETN98913.1 hypothetical protein RFI_38575 [Reticulomyxa filosa]